MNHAVALLQGLFASVAFLAPGLAVLLWATRRTGAAWPLPWLLAGSFVVSSLLVTVVQGASLSLLPPGAARWVGWAFVALALAWLAWGGWRQVRAAVAAVGVWERRALAILALIAAFWCATMPLSPYPSHLTMQLGDTPIYYRAATNLVAGRGWTPDYFIGDYPDGKMAYVETHPVPVLVTTLFFQAFGTNWHSLYVYDALAGALLVYLLVGVARSGARAPSGDGPHVLLLTLGLVALPAHFIMFGLGVVTAPGALAFLAAVAFPLAQSLPRTARWLGFGSAIVFLLGVRPEAAVLAVLLLFGTGLRWLFTRVCRGWRTRSLAVAACAGVALGFWWMLPRLVERHPSAWKGLILFYLDFDAERGRFFLPQEPWWDVNREIARANLSGEDPFARLGNPAIGRAIRDHPVAFLGYLLSHLPRSSKILLRSVTVAQYPMDALEGLPSLAVLAALVALGAMARGGRTAVGVVLAYVVLLPALNPAPEVRHLAAVSPALLALALRALWQRWGHLAERAAANRWVVIAAAAPLLVLAFLDCRSIIQIRRYAPNRYYEPILREIEKLAAPGDVIASAYPSLITCMTGRRSVGATWLTDNLELVVRGFKPDFIIVDNGRQIPRDYDLLREKGLAIPGYEPVVHDAEAQYIIFRTQRPRPPRGPS